MGWQELEKTGVEPKSAKLSTGFPQKQQIFTFRTLLLVFGFLLLDPIPAELNPKSPFYLGRQ